MELLWFLGGLFIGLGCLSWYHVRLIATLRHLTQSFEPDVLRSSFPVTSQLTRAIALYGEAQQQLSQELETWQNIFQTAPIGFLQVDEENQLVWCNAQARRLLGISTITPTRLLLELVRSYELDALIEQTRILSQPRQVEWNFHPISLDASTLSRQLPCPLRAHSILLNHGGVGVFLENRQEVVLLMQQRDRWISDVAHELKTPLTSIRLVAETLQLRLEPPHRDWIDRLLKETIRLSGLVQDLLDLSHLEAKPIHSLQLKTVDLARSVQSAWLSLEPLARRKHLQLDYCGPDQLLLQADESRLHRVLLNLLDNSIQYSPFHQCIRVQLSYLPEATPSGVQKVLLEVIDAGPGFPESALPHVFDRFYRVDPSRARSSNDQAIANPQATSLPLSRSVKKAPPEAGQFVLGGSGLGLAIVRQIVEAHQGSVSARNHPETHGAWIQVVLPCQPLSEGC